ncbi:MAG TPA: BlaI/MecI/CopY family transcriptional regulator [bacterium]|nr:BlaI/MecI/CopY family transcriptional regulator [bacterium]
MNKPEKQLTELEWELMNHIWAAEEEKVTVRDILERAYPDGGKAYTTIQTVMNTLVEKGFLSKEKIGLVNFYQPAKPREQVVQKEVGHFVHKVFRGSTPQFVKQFIDSSDLTREEIADLKRFIEAKESNIEEDPS